MTLRRSFVQLLPCNGGHNRLVGSALGSLSCLTQHCVLNPPVADGGFFFFSLGVTTGPYTTLFQMRV